MGTRSRVVVIGTSWGGLAALRVVLQVVGPDFAWPILVVQHRAPGKRDHLTALVQEMTPLNVVEAADKMMIKPRTVYLAPANYHLLVERDFSLSLSIDEKVNYSRPAIDVLFETAAEAYRSALIAVLLTGASNDGTNGLRVVQAFGGLTIAQSPQTAEVALMPQSAIEAGVVDFVFDLEEIGEYLTHVAKNVGGLIL
ncbi:MAG TPA: chemotaxis protein CheB [Anaerolineae bacterium]|nr:chemotaxis protein CheB [Anaerolineae bacterium]